MFDVKQEVFLAASSLRDRLFGLPAIASPIVPIGNRFFDRGSYEDGSVNYTAVVRPVRSLLWSIIIRSCR